MKLLIPYIVKINDAQTVALGGERYHHRTNQPPHRPDPISMNIEYHNLGHKHAYGDLLAEFWNRGDSFILLEQDVLPWPGALTEMWNCPKSWCAMPLVVHQCVNETNLGCVKFGKEFIETFPDLWKSYPRNDIFDWRSLDSWLYQQLEPDRHHRHSPPAIHLNPNHI